MTRQDAFCFLDRYLKETGAQLTQPSGDELSAFSDSAEISDYAEESVATLTASGIVNGQRRKNPSAGHADESRNVQDSQRIADKVTESSVCPIDFRRLREKRLCHKTARIK